MKLLGHELKGFPKALVILVAVLLVASGLCGVTNLLEARYDGWYRLPNNAWGNFLGISGVIEWLAMSISAAGAAFVLIVWPISVIYRLAAKPEKDRVESLFARKDESKRDDKR